MKTVCTETNLIDGVRETDESLVPSLTEAKMLGVSRKPVMRLSQWTNKGMK